MYLLSTQTAHTVVNSVCEAKGSGKMGDVGLNPVYTWHLLDADGYGTVIPLYEQQQQWYRPSAVCTLPCMKTRDMQVYARATYIRS